MTDNDSFSLGWLSSSGRKFNQGENYENYTEDDSHLNTTMH